MMHRSWKTLVAGVACLALVMAGRGDAVADVGPIPYSNLGQPNGPAKLDGAGRASAVPVLPSGALIARSLATRLGGQVADLRDYAVGDGTADDTAGVAAWLNSGKALSMSPGKYRITSHITTTLPAGVGISITGAGRQLSQFILASATAGITINAPAPDLYTTPSVVMRSFSLVPTTQVTGAALAVSYVSTGIGPTDPMVSVEDVHVRPSAAGNYAAICFSFENASISRFAYLTCEGNRGGPVPGSIGIKYFGDGAPVDTSFTDLHTFWMETGIDISGTWQGLTVQNSRFLAARIGLRATSATNNEYTLFASNNVFDATDYGVQAVGVQQVKVFHNLVYLRDWMVPAAAHRTGVSITVATTATVYGVVKDNHIEDVSARPHTGHYGVFLDGVGAANNKSTVQDNTILGHDYGVVFGSGINAAYLGHNDYVNIGTFNVLNNGINVIQAAAPINAPSGRIYGP